MQKLSENGYPEAAVMTADAELPTGISRPVARRFVIGAMGATLAGIRPAAAQAGVFATLLNQLQTSRTLLEQSWLFQDRSVSQGIPRGNPSTRNLGKNAYDLIIACEVGSPDAYKKRGYNHPIWPGGSSGVTVGMGYDLGASNKEWLKRDWPAMKPQDLALLSTVVKLSGQAAKAKLHSVASVDIPWDEANDQFNVFIHYPTADTEAAFPNCSELSDDSFGALVSLVYNRGASTNKKDPKRLEMYQIKELMTAKKYSEVPDRITAMKHIWQNIPDARGLLIRRDAEAALFKQGLAKA